MKTAYSGRNEEPAPHLVAVRDLIATQRKYFNRNVTRSVDFRLTQLKTLRDVLRNNEGLLQQAIYEDYGKGPFETFLSEFFLIHDEIEAAIRNLRDWSSRKPVTTHQLNMPARSYIVPEPLGVSLIIGPWNYPYQLALAPVAAAFAAGCTAILKPSELTARVSGVLAKLVRDHFDPGYFAVVEGGVPETTALLAEKFDFIFFTGSVPVGRIVYAAAAKHLTPIVLELGGKSPAIIAPDCKLDIAVRRLVWAKFLNAGQTCIAPDYVFVHRSLYEEFLNRVRREIEAADYRLENGNYVHIINERNTSRIISLIDHRKVVVGGGHNTQGRFIEPTVLKDVTWNDRVMQEEIFGPVLPVMPYEELDDVIAQIKARAKPLALYLFTEDSATKDKVLSEVSFGGGCINDAVVHVTNGELPFGGVGESGMGSYHGEAGFRAFSHYKSILDREVVPDPDVKYPPYTDEKLAILKSVVGVGA